MCRNPQSSWNQVLTSAWTATRDLHSPQPWPKNLLSSWIVLKTETRGGPRWSHVYHPLQSSETITEKPEDGKEGVWSVVLGSWHGSCSQELPAAVIVRIKATQDWYRKYSVINGGWTPETLPGGANSCPGLLGERKSLSSVSGSLHTHAQVTMWKQKKRCRCCSLCLSLNCSLCLRL